MTNFLIKTVANAAALLVAVWLVAGITLTDDDTGRQALTLVLVALIFGLVNFVLLAAGFGLTFFVPDLVQDRTGYTDFEVGVLAAIPFAR